ncbi:MAG: NYN domain-containing protein [Candidatus Eisenbacteria bacterium]|nr:NYN domain-containing protein [Candidatus Eisenbacteria bacterium]
MNRTSFLVDGFNLYHSLRDASRALGGVGTKWLDLRSLCDSYLYQIGGSAQTVGVFYFSALARHLEATNPGITARHVDYLSALRSRGVTVELAHFKEKRQRCPHPTCRLEIKRHEEKETDVAIALKLLELLWLDQCDSVVLLTGDSDLAPAIRAARRLAPHKRIYCLFPHARGSIELRNLAARTFRIKKERYAQFQLPDGVQLLDGRAVSKPQGW